jgi:hypothetical protein
VPFWKLGFQPDSADMLPACRYRNQTQSELATVSRRPGWH